MTDEVPRIVEARVSLRNAVEVDALLNLLPPEIDTEIATAIRRAAARGFHGMRWHGATRRAIYFNSDGMTLLCVTLPAITEVQATLCEGEIRKRGCHDSFEGIVACYQAVTSREPMVVRHRPI
jgi:hypothetical protein